MTDDKKTTPQPWRPGDVPPHRWRADRHDTGAEKASTATADPPRASLEQWNNARYAQYAYGQNPANTSNGIACPGCGEGMHDSEPGFVYTSAPGKTTVHCPSCGWQGMRLA